MKTIKLFNPIWRYHLVIRVGGSRDLAFEYAKRWLGDSRVMEGAQATTFTCDGEKNHLIWFGESPSPGIVAHEALHSVAHVLRLSGLGALDEANEEAFAYLLQWTVEAIMAKL